MVSRKQPYFALLGIDPNTFTLSDFGQQLIQATLDFANMRGAEPSEVDAIFSPFRRDMWILARPKPEEPMLKKVQTRRQATLLTGKVYRSRTRDTYRRQQQDLFKALGDIVDKGTVGSSLHNKLDRWLKEIPFSIGFVKGSLVYRFSVGSVGAGWALGLATLLDSDCQLRCCEECFCYIAIFNRQAQQRRYCEACAKDVNREKTAKRLRKWRQRKKSS